MNKEKFMLRCAAYLVLQKEGTILLLRRANTGYWDGSYSMVAGHVDGNETIAHAMAREAKEETGIEIEEMNLRVIHAQHRICPDNVEYIDFYLTAQEWTGELKNMEPQKCDDLRWYPIDKLPENTIPYIRTVIEYIQNGVTFSEFAEK